MDSSKLSVLGSAFLVLSLPSSVLGARVAVPELLSVEPFQAKEKGHNFQIMESTHWVIEPSGETNSVKTSYVELASGLNYLDENGEFQASDPTIEVSPDGTFAAAAKLGQKVTFEANLNTEGAVQILTPDGQLLKATVLALAYYDPISGTDVTLGVVKDSIGQVIDGNKIVYGDAFTNLKVDVVYEVTKRGIMQMVVLQEAPPPPGDFGLSPVSYLEVMTEFFDPPAPAKKEELLDQVRDPALRAQMVSPDFVDEELTFGQSRIGKGAAFWRDNMLEEGPEPQADHPVGKRWRSGNGRTILFESTEIHSIQEELDRLPEATWNGAWIEQKKDRAIAQLDIKTRTFPNHRFTLRNLTNSIEIAQAGRPSKGGLVLDWSFVNVTGTVTNYTFDAATTYYVSDQLNLNGTTTMEGGTVIKLGPYSGGSPSPSLFINGGFVSTTSIYRPITVTARDDNTIGVILSGSDGNPGTEKFGNVGLYFLNSENVSIENFRFRHQSTGVAFGNSSTKTRAISHSQFLNCKYALWNRYDTTLEVKNNLVVNCSDAVFYSYQNADFHAVNLTVNGSTNLIYNLSGTGSMELENSLLVGIGTIQSYTNQGASHNKEISSSAGLFTDSGAGGHYLVAGSPYRNIGVAIDSDLAKDFRQMTTYAPTVVEDYTIGADTTWDYTVERDYDYIDLGYHYPAIDYAVNDVEIGGSAPEAATLTIQPGVGIATFGDHGIRLMTYGEVIGKGTQTQKINVVRYSTIQEQIEDWGSTAYSTYPPSSIVGPDHALQTSSTHPSITLRFVDFHQPADYGRTFYSGNGHYAFDDIFIKDCRFFGGEFKLSGVNNVIVSSLGINNNLFQRSKGSIGDWGAFDVRNNLFWKCSLTVAFGYSGGTKTVKENAFDATTISQSSADPTHGYNAYLNGATRLTTNQGTDVVVSSFSYQSGVLGEFYQATSTTLDDVGSQTASAAGLYHHTIFTTADSKDVAPYVDLGFHYVGTDSDGNPIDTDGDGIPDYLEDYNGNGSVDSGETNPGLSENGTSTVGGYFQIFTMLN